MSKNKLVTNGIKDFVGGIAEGDILRWKSNNELYLVTLIDESGKPDKYALVNLKGGFMSFSELTTLDRIEQITNNGEWEIYRGNTIIVDLGQRVPF